MSPSGKFFVVLRDTNGSMAYVVSLDGKLLRTISRGSDGHMDLGYMPDGVTEVAYVGRGWYANLATGAMQDLGRGYAPGIHWHSSTRNIRAPGWGFSTIGPGDSTLFDGEIVADELKPGGRTFRLAHHRTTGNGFSDGGYSRGSMPVPSPDGLRVLFRSDWGNSSGAVQAYVIDLR
jgi:hypothetical protein